MVKIQMMKNKREKHSFRSSSLHLHSSRTILLLFLFFFFFQKFACCFGQMPVKIGRKRKQNNEKKIQIKYDENGAHKFYVKLLVLMRRTQSTCVDFFSFSSCMRLSSSSERLSFLPCFCSIRCQ